MDSSILMSVIQILTVKSKLCLKDSLVYFGMKLKNVLKHICDWTSPDCWSDSKPEVRELLESIRQYRHHDDNIFTVQFSATNTTCSDD